jgi:hypothetical protein
MSSGNNGHEFEESFTGLSLMAEVRSTMLRTEDCPPGASKELS